MWFFKRREEREKKEAETEAEILRINQEKLKKSTEAVTKMDMVQKLIRDNPDDVAKRIFAATGGDKRINL